LAVALTSLHGTFARAEIYRYTDEAGRVVYTNVTPKSAKNVSIVTEQISIIPSTPIGRALLPAPSSSGGNHKSHSFDNSSPNINSASMQIDNNTQKNRDSTRKNILLEELNTELKALDDAKKQKVQKLTSDVEEAIQSHERNINALQKELGMH
jgi:hypothetical protein